MDNKHKSNNTLEYLGMNARKDVQDLNVQKIKLNTKLKMETLRKPHINERYAMLVTRRAGCPKDGRFSRNLSTDLMKMQPQSGANEFSRNVTC